MRKSKPQGDADLPAGAGDAWESQRRLTLVRHSRLSGLHTFRQSTAAAPCAPISRHSCRDVAAALPCDLHDNPTGATFLREQDRVLTADWNEGESAPAE